LSSCKLKGATKVNSVRSALATAGRSSIALWLRSQRRSECDETRKMVNYA
jgi:hypothetical protein